LFFEINLQIPELNVSYKPQTIAPKFEGTVKELLQTKIKDAYLHPTFVSEVARPMKLDDIIDQDVQKLSGLLLSFYLININFNRRGITKSGSYSSTWKGC
jgi:translation initiation factor RLI1